MLSVNPASRRTAENDVLIFNPKRERGIPALLFTSLMLRITFSAVRAEFTTLIWQIDTFNEVVGKNSNDTIVTPAAGSNFHSFRILNEIALGCEVVSNVPCSSLILEVQNCRPIFIVHVTVTESRNHRFLQCWHHSARFETTLCRWSVRVVFRYAEFCLLHQRLSLD